jgi:hypothetical protein
LGPVSLRKAADGVASDNGIVDGRHFYFEVDPSLFMRSTGSSVSVANLELSSLPCISEDWDANTTSLEQNQNKLGKLRASAIEDWSRTSELQRGE